MRASSREIDAAVERNDYRTVDRLLNQQLSEVMQGLVLEDFTTGQTGSLLTRSMAGAKAEANVTAVAIQMIQRRRVMSDLLKQHNWAEIESFGNDIVRQYKERNGADRVDPKPGMSEQEMFELSLQFEPIQVDPNLIANFRQRLVKLDNDMKQYGTSVWKDPRTARIANVLQANAELGRAGLLQDQEQNINDQLDPFTKHVGLPVIEGIDTFVGEAVDLGMGARDLLQKMGAISLDGLTNGNADAYYQGPTAWVQDRDGTWYNNGGKVGATELYAGIWYGLTGEMIDQGIAEYATNKATAVEQSRGMQKLSIGLSHFTGSMAAFLGTGVPAMKAGSFLTNGIKIAAGGGRAAKSLSRTSKIVRLLGEKIGPAAALGSVQAVKGGRIEGYGTAMLHGTVMAVPMMVMGAIGDRLERTLLRYVHMPAPIARTLAGTVEGIGLDLGTWEAGWQFVRDPSERNLAELTQQVLVNSIGNGILRGTGLTSAPHEAALPPDKARALRDERRQAAVRAVAADEPQALASERGTEVEPVLDLGSATGEMRDAAGDRPQTAARAAERARQSEGILAQQEAGVTMSERDKLEARYATREELKRLLEQPPSPERTQEIIKLLDQSRLAFGKDFASFVKKTAETIDEGLQKKQAEQTQISEAGDVVNALLGSRQASDYKAARKRALAEVQEGKAAEVEARLAEKQGVSRATGMKDPLGDTGNDAPLSDLRRSSRSGEREGAIPGEAEQLPGVSRGLHAGESEEAQGPGTGGEAAGERAESRQPGEAARPAAGEAVRGLPGAERGDASRGLPEAARGDVAMSEVSPGEAQGVAEARAPKDKSPGTPASLRMQPTLEQEGVPGTKPIRQADVIRDLQGYDGELVRVDIRKGVGIRGKRSTKGILGWYSLHDHLIRLLRAEDVVVATHEWAHSMDLTVGATHGFLRDLPDNILKDFEKAAAQWYPGYEKMPRAGRYMESWAEFWARHMLDDPTLAEETGAFHKWAMDWITQPTQKPLLDLMQYKQASLRRFRDQGALERSRQRWKAEYERETEQELKARGVMKDTPLHRIRGFLRKAHNIFMKTMVDDVAPLREAQFRALANQHGPEKAEQILASMPITANPTRLMDVYRMTASKQAEAFLMIGTHDIAGNKTGESLREVFDGMDEDTYEKFITYVISKRSVEARNKGVDPGGYREDDLTTIEKYESEDFINRAKRLKAWSDRLIDYAEQGGLFSAKQAADIKGGYEFYIPFQRVLDGPKQHAPGRGVAERGSGVKSMKGANETIADPVNALGDLARTIITKTQQSMVMKAMVRFGNENPKVGSFITEVKRGVIPSDHPMAQIADAIRRAADPKSEEMDFEIQKITQSLEDLSATGELAASLTLFGQQTIPKGSRPIIAIRTHYTEAELEAMSPKAKRLAEDQNGKLLWWEVDKDAYEVLMGIDQPQTVMDKMPDWTKAVLEKPGELLRFGATVASPGFAVRNMIRDAVSDSIYTSDKNKAWFLSGFGRLARGLADRGSDAADVFDALGGGVSTFFAGEVAAGRTARELLKLNRGWRGKVTSAVHAYTDKLSKWTEQPLRTEAFVRTRDEALLEGRSELDANLEALEAAKEITINFTRGGTISRALNRLVPYLIAGIQGNRKFFMTLAGKNGDVPMKVAWTRALTNLTIPTIALWWLNKDEEWYQELPDWRRLNYWNVKMPFTDEVLSLPKPFELGKLFGNVPEAMADQAFSTHPMEMTETALDAVTSILPPWPLGAAWRPIIEVATNHDFFTGREIVPGWLRDSRLPKDQVTAYTRWFGKTGAAIARSFGFDPSPMVVEHFLDAMTGGMAGRLSDSLTSVGGLTTALKGEGLRDIPAVGTLFRQGNFEQSRSVQQVFDLDKQYTQIAGSGTLTQQQVVNRRIVARAKEDITALKKQAREGTMDRRVADKLAADVARKAVSRIR